MLCKKTQTKTYPWRKKESRLSPNPYTVDSPWDLVDKIPIFDFCDHQIFWTRLQWPFKSHRLWFFSTTACHDWWLISCSRNILLLVATVMLLILSTVDNNTVIMLTSWCWWLKTVDDFLDIGDNFSTFLLMKHKLCKIIVDVGDQNSQNCHQ